MPDDNRETAIFGNTSNAPATVYSEKDILLKGIRFTNAYSYGLTGSGDVNVTLEAATGNAFIEVLNGNHEFQLPVNLASTTGVNVVTGSEVVFDSALNLGGNTATKTGGGTMVLNNNASTGTGSLEVQDGTLAGAGKLSGDLTVMIGATTAPGASAGMLKVGGNYTQNAGATLAVEIGGTLPEENFDVLEIAGTASLAGTLDVALIDSYTPAMNEQFTILSAVQYRWFTQPGWFGRWLV